MRQHETLALFFMCFGKSNEIEKGVGEKSEEERCSRCNVLDSQKDSVVLGPLLPWIALASILMENFTRHYLVELFMWRVQLNLLEVDNKLACHPRVCLCFFICCCRGSSFVDLTSSFVYPFIHISHTLRSSVAVCIIKVCIRRVLNALSLLSYQLFKDLPASKQTPHRRSVSYSLDSLHITNFRYRFQFKNLRIYMLSEIHQQTNLNQLLSQTNEALAFILRLSILPSPS